MIPTDELSHRHEQMLEFQAKIAPFTPSIEDLRDVWAMQRTSVHYTLRKLVAMGLCIVRERGWQTQGTQLLCGDK